MNCFPDAEIEEEENSEEPETDEPEVEDVLSKDEWVVNKNVSLIMGGTTADDMVIVKGKKNHIVLTTYGFGRRGISLVDMTALIMCSPRRNGLNQILGRVMRRGSDQSIVREIYDIVDMRSMLRYQFKEREKLYIARNYPIIDSKHWWNDL